MSSCRKIFPKIFAALIVLFLIASALASEEREIIQLSISYDINFNKVELLALKAMPGYLSEEEKPGNATIYLLSNEGTKLYEIRVAFIQPTVLISPPRIDTDTNTVIGDYNAIYPNEGLKQVNVPYYKQAASVKILFDKNKEFAFPIAERLCNNNNSCDEDESALSCKDCEVDKQDGICVAAQDGICDPDCFRGVDPDCIPTAQTPTATQREPQVTPTPTQVSTEFSAISFIPILLAILLALLALLYYKKIKGE